MSQTTEPGWQLGVLRACALVFLTLLWMPAASAQRDASLDAMLKEANMKGRAADDSPVPHTHVSDVNRLVHWRLWKRVVTTGTGTGKDELTALEHDGRSVGYVNQETYAMAVAGIASSMTDVEKGLEMFRHSEHLAPDLPYVYFAHAKYAFDRNPGVFHEWTTAWFLGMERAYRWPDTRFAWTLKFLMFALFAMGLGAFVFAFGQIIRQFGIVAYDVAAVLPGDSRAIRRLSSC